MKTEISKQIADDPRLHPLVEHANELLKTRIVPAKETVTARWSQDGTKGWGLLILDLIDDATGDSGATVFNPDELTDDEYLIKRLHGVWGDLLQVSTHRLLKQLAG